MLQSMFSVDELKNFEFYAVLPGKKGNGRRMTVQAHNEDEVVARGGLMAQHRFKVSYTEIKIHMVSALGNLNDNNEE